MALKIWSLHWSAIYFQSSLGISEHAEVGELLVWIHQVLSQTSFSLRQDFRNTSAKSGFIYKREREAGSYTDNHRTSLLLVKTSEKDGRERT